MCLELEDVKDRYGLIMGGFLSALKRDTPPLLPLGWKTAGPARGRGEEREGPPCLGKVTALSSGP